MCTFVKTRNKFNQVFLFPIYAIEVLLSLHKKTPSQTMLVLRIKEAGNRTIRQFKFYIKMYLHVSDEQDSSYKNCINMSLINLIKFIFL